MTWARLEDDYYSHPKLVSAGLEATGLDVRAISYAARHETNGFISDAMLPVIAAGAPKPPSIAARLVTVGRWERDEPRGGWWIHDFLDYNPSAEELAEKRRQDRDRKSKGRGSQGRDAAGRVTSGVDSKRNPPGIPVDSAGSHTGPDPDPDPVPKGLSSSSEDQLVATQRADDDEIWLGLAKRRLSREANVRKPTAWTRRVADNAHAELRQQAIDMLTRYPDLTCAELGEHLDGGALPVRYRLRPVDATAAEVWDELEDGSVARRKGAS